MIVGVGHMAAHLAGELAGAEEPGFGLGGGADGWVAVEVHPARLAPVDRRGGCLSRRVDDVAESVSRGSVVARVR
jgi:hypothetical protein